MVDGQPWSTWVRFSSAHCTLGEEADLSTGLADTELRPRARGRTLTAPATLARSPTRRSPTQVAPRRLSPLVRPFRLPARSGLQGRPRADLRNSSLCSLVQVTTADRSRTFPGSGSARAPVLVKTTPDPTSRSDEVLPRSTSSKRVRPLSLPSSVVRRQERRLTLVVGDASRGRRGE